MPNPDDLIEISYSDIDFDNIYFDSVINDPNAIKAEHALPEYWGDGETTLYLDPSNGLIYEKQQGTPGYEDGTMVGMGFVTEQNRDAIVSAHTPATTEPTATSPAGETPAGETPAGETPAGETPAGETPAGETPAGETPAGETPARAKTAGETPAGGSGGGATIINEKEKALSTTLTNTEFITAVGTDAETEGSGAAAIVETFKDDFGSAIDTYISGITGQIDALQTACTKQTNKGLYGEEITNTVNTLLNNLYTSLTEYAEAVQTAEKDIIAEVEKMFLNADETISGAMDADSALLATGEVPAAGGNTP